MPIRLRVMAVLTAASLLAGLLGACSAGPVSQATTVPGTDAPSAAASPSPTAEPSAAATDTPAADTPAADTPAPTERAAVPTDVPPKPGKPTFTLVNTTLRSGGGSTVEYEITWTSPAGLADEFLVYGVTTCLRESKQYNGKPCIVKGMKIPKASLKLIGRAFGAARTMTVTWDENEVGPSRYWSVLIRATNSFGNSIFTIVHTENVCYQCTY